MARLSETQTAALASWWTLAIDAAFGGFTATDTIQAAAELARQRGGSLTFNESSAIATLYGYARRMSNAAGAVQAAAAAAEIGPEHTAVPPWARDEVTMATAPIWHVTYTFETMDTTGRITTEFRTSVFEMVLPGTIGELADAIDEDAQALADKYGVTLVGARLHQILAV